MTSVDGARIAETTQLRRVLFIAVRSGKFSGNKGCKGDEFPVVTDLAVYAEGFLYIKFSLLFGLFSLQNVRAFCTSFYLSASFFLIRMLNKTPRTVYRGCSHEFSPLVFVFVGHHHCAFTSPLTFYSQHVSVLMP